MVTNVDPSVSDLDIIEASYDLEPMPGHSMM